MMDDTMDDMDDMDDTVLYRWYHDSHSTGWPWMTIDSCWLLMIAADCWRSLTIADDSWWQLMIADDWFELGWLSAEGTVRSYSVWLHDYCAMAGWWRRLMADCLGVVCVVCVVCVWCVMVVSLLCICVCSHGLERTQTALRRGHPVYVVCCMLYLISCILYLVSCIL